MRFSQQTVLVPGSTRAVIINWSRPHFIARPGYEKAFERLGATSKNLGHAATLLSFSTTCVGQWRHDAEEFGVDPMVRRVRSVYRGAAVAGASTWVGATSGHVGFILGTVAASMWSAFVSGAAVGTMAAPGPGTIICGVLCGIGGGIVGGIGATKVANAVVDKTIDPLSAGISSAADWFREG
ncbi:hypothetical protein [Streptomyces lunaelactis]|uniref:hypothetical protein n=1 Tax=Streptomyces lunaelactis TaxID=1535768 RepID=UPI0015850ABF|nr:hypothetical protein [Streptomyces lunaelactis]NUK01095.1 hypothetical protein [Streptomyces lunaelactis]